MRGKLEDAQQNAERARDAVNAADTERDELCAPVKGLEARKSKGPVQHQQQKGLRMGGGKVAAL